MKLSAPTISILKNFAAINSGIVFSPGNTIASTNLTKTILAVATINENFPSEVPIGNLGELLNAINLFPNHDITFNEGYLGISALDSEGKPTGTNLRYVHSQSKIISPPATNLPTAGEFVSLNLTKAALENIIRACAVMKLEYLTVSAVAGSSEANLKLHGDFEGNEFNTTVPATVTASGSATLKMDVVHLLPGEYNLTVTPKMVKFDSPTVKYYFGVQSGKKK